MKKKIKDIEDAEDTENDLSDGYGTWEGGPAPLD